MKTDIISTRIDHGMKIEFTHVCEEIGLSPSQAIKLFAKAVINHGGIPFELKTKQPNMITLQAIQELEEGKGNKTNSTSELFNDLQVKLKNA
jgi:DNA-damage-inducible protein J